MKCLHIILLSVFTGIVCGKSCKCGREAAMSRIIGGTTVPEKKYPWICQILSKKNIGPISEWGVCGGSIITDKHILTAAHCVKDADEVKYLCGEVQRTILSPSQATDAANTVIHEKYDVEGESRYYDIAIVTAKDSLMFAPICLPEAQTSYSGSVIIAGWGATSYSHYALPNNFLMEATTDIVPISKCNDYWKGFLDIPQIPEDTIFCVGDEKHRGRAGDSGGPVMQKSDGKMNLLGIQSKEYAHEEFKPGLDVNVSYYLEWIKKHTTDGEYCDN